MGLTFSWEETNNEINNILFKKITEAFYIVNKI